MTKLSIAIPTYEMNGQGATYLTELFETIKFQTFQDIEVCVSDHSQDDSILDVCGEYANYFTVQYYKNEEKRGNGPANTNSAVEMCSGEITKIIFQDDLLISSTALQRIVETYEHFRPMIPKWTPEMLEGRNLLGSPSGVSFLTKKFLPFDEELVLLMDTDFYHRMRYDHGMPYIIEEHLTSNREHDNRISSSTVKYNARVEHPEGPWLVNAEELNYVIDKHLETRKYPDEEV
jgi:glycosyltransferase involved in cell wall biosynthesis